MNKDTLIIYTLKNCIICNQLKGELKKLNIDFIDIVIDDGSAKNYELGNQLEFQYETNSYPIIYFLSSKTVFLTKTDLEEHKRLIIFNNLEELINQIKQKCVIKQP